MSKSRSTLLAVWLLLFSGCVHPRAISRQPVAKSPYRAIKPRALANSVRPVFKTSGGRELGAGEGQDFAYQGNELTLEEVTMQCRRLGERGLQIVELDCLQQAQSRLPSPDPVLDIEMSRAWLELGNARAALPFIGRARTALPDSPTPLFLLGVALSDLGNDQSARDAFQLSLQRDPGQPFALLRLGEALLELGDAEGAIGKLEKALDLTQELPKAQELLAQAYLEIGNEPEAIQILSHLHGRLDALQRVGELYFAQGDWKSSKRAFEELDQLAPGNPAARAKLALLDSLLPRPTVVQIGPFGKTTPVMLARAREEASPKEGDVRRLSVLESDDSEILELLLQTLPAPKDLLVSLIPVDPSDGFARPSGSGRAVPALVPPQVGAIPIDSHQIVKRTSKLESDRASSQKEILFLDVSAENFKKLFFANAIDMTLPAQRQSRSGVSKSENESLESPQRESSDFEASLARGTEDRAKTGVKLWKPQRLTDLASGFRPEPAAAAKDLVDFPPGSRRGSGFKIMPYEGDTASLILGTGQPTVQQSTFKAADWKAGATLSGNLPLDLLLLLAVAAILFFG